MIEFTATPCCSWHPGPDATPLIIWRRQRMWKIVYIVPCTASRSPPPPWIHVFSKSSANSSLCTQCAAVASVDAYCPSVFHCHLCRARTKHCKKDRLLWEIVVPPTQVKMSTTEIDTEIIVFDRGGGQMSPPIWPPDGIGGAPSQSETFTLKTILVVTSVFLSQELMGLPPSFVCLVKFHLKVLWASIAVNSFSVFHFYFE